MQELLYYLRSQGVSADIDELIREKSDNQLRENPARNLSNLKSRVEGIVRILPANLVYHFSSADNICCRLEEELNQIFDSTALPDKGIDFRIGHGFDHVGPLLQLAGILGQEPTDQNMHHLALGGGLALVQVLARVRARGQAS